MPAVLPPIRVRDPKSRIVFVISDWGTQTTPLIVTFGGETLRLVHNYGTAPQLDRIARIAGWRDGNREQFHLGFYGYLRMCDAISQAERGRQCINQMKPEWREEFYDLRVTPELAVTSLPTP